MPTELRTSRLLLRQWVAADRVPFAKLNADAQVMEHFPALLSKKESDTMADYIEAHIEQYGWGFWAVEVSGVAAFAGFIGLAKPLFEAHFTPCTEVGWRLAVEFWGRGYASEGAAATLTFGFERLALPEIVSFTVPANLRSRRVMERIGRVRNQTTISIIQDCPKAISFGAMCSIGRQGPANNRMVAMLPTGSVRSSGGVSRLIGTLGISIHEVAVFRPGDEA